MTDSSAQQPAAFEIGDLPKPPEAIGTLLETSQVEFEAGPRPESSGSTSDRRIVAETHYRIAYNYRSQTSWRLVDQGRKLIVKVRYMRLRWKPMHTIWFLKRPAAEGFWSSPLVLHELDHVRISSDRRLAKRFEQLLKDQPVLNRTIANGETVNRKFVEALVDQHVEQVFAEISDLIAIRYQELDRVTSHGRRPLPADSELNQWLRAEPSEP